MAGVLSWTCWDQEKRSSGQTDGKSNPSQAACVSDNLRGLGYAICGHKSKDITPSIALRREAKKEEAMMMYRDRSRKGHCQ